MSNNGLIVLIPYSTGQDFYPEYEYYNESQDDEEENEEIAEVDEDDNLAYLPVFVETKDKDLALMAVAKEVSIGSYVACPSVTEQEWENEGYPGTLKNPGVDLPSTYEAFEIPEPGDCFCCAGMSDYEVITPKEMVKRLKVSKQGYLLSYIEDDDDLWEQFNNWCVEVLNYSIFLPKQ
jgi:hypothetical protein